ncbi:DUF1501 domain-containing protein (plasmid) [Photobacterium sp. DA100]|uniref:DUF1501 domain-containing protein n=1 Tax=Photobacterium sp. DA100 TaxID=3027472 RepID=UPI0024791F51|nr:DUF1501 domain-containing protein [Photobacterium sp. DA100]WEM44484.1 DUF1501 domain-containing protein [Photobacterium sp. DA100]
MKLSRRNFIKSSISGIGISTLGMSSPLAQAFGTCEPKQYRALIAINLSGGNDGFNMFIPRETASYHEYSIARAKLAISIDDIIPLYLNDDPNQLGLHPALAPLQPFFDLGLAAPVVNTGPLLQPVTKTQIQNDPSLLPDKLYAHNYQSQIVQTNTGATLKQDGWGGEGLDLVLSSLSDTSSMYSMSSSSNIWAYSRNITPNLLGNSLPPNFNFDGHQQAEDLFNDLRKTDSVDSNIHRQFFSTESLRAREQYALFSGIISDDNDLGFPSSDFGKQCRRVYQMIKEQAQLSQAVQCFSLNLGGFDTHSNQLKYQHNLLDTLATSLATLFSKLKDDGLADNVTAFTFSEFGRTLEPNDSGTDHGWGSNHLVMSGDLNGGQVFGQWPSLVVDGEQSLSRGRMIPTLASDQLHATLLNWLGVSSDGLDYLFPALEKFNPQLLPLFTSCGGGVDDYQVIPQSIEAEQQKDDEPPIHAVDGQLATKWSAKGLGIPFTLHFDKPHQLHTLKVAQNKGDQRQYFFTVEYSEDGTVFNRLTEIITPGNSDLLVELPLGSVSAQSIRLVCNGNNDPDDKRLREWNNFRIIEVWAR